MEREIVDLLTQLTETADNGRLGFAEASERLAERGHPEISSTFAEISERRATFAQALRDLDTRGDVADDADTTGSTPGAIHRTWIAVKDRVGSDKATSILKSVSDGEDHAVTVYTEALDADFPSEVRSTIELQLTDIKESQKLVAALLRQSESATP